MSDFKKLAAVLKRCKLEGILTLAVGSPSQLEMRNTRAMETLQGMRKQPENKEMREAMEIEWQFLRARKKYLATKKLKKPLLVRALKIAEKSSADKSFVEFIEERTKAYTSYFSKHSDLEEVQKMNKIVEKIGEKAVRKILHSKSERSEKYPHKFQDLTLIFPDEGIRKSFIEGKYKEAIRKLKNSEDFDSQIALAVCRIEQFKAEMHALLKNSRKNSAKRLDRFMSQWSSLYTKSVDLFSANFMDEEYLHAANREVSYTPVGNSILFHPITYDLSSMYIRMPQEEQTSTAGGISGVLSRMSIFRK